jgi:type VI secretion system (T6SS) effector TldE1-like protein
MWKYSQSTGDLFNADGELVDTGYAGKGNAKNDPDQQCVADMGPIPRGYYAIQPGINHPKLGPVALRLEPDAGNNMCGRAGFFIHGDKVSDPGNASEGCIIMKRTTREAVDRSNDKRLQVARQSSLSLAAQPARRRRRTTKAYTKRKPKRKNKPA